MSIHEIFHFLCFLSGIFYRNTVYKIRQTWKFKYKIFRKNKCEVQWLSLWGVACRASPWGAARRASPWGAAHRASPWGATPEPHLGEPPQSLTLGSCLQSQCWSFGCCTEEPCWALLGSLVVFQSLSCVWLSATLWTAACQTSLSFTISWSLLKLMSIRSVMPSNHLVLCHPLLPLIFPSIRFFSNESALRIRWPQYWSFSFSISPSNDYSGLISFRVDWFDLLAVPGTHKSLLQHHSSKASVLQHSAFFLVQFSPSVHDYWENHSFDYTDLGWQSNVSAF